MPKVTTCSLQGCDGDVVARGFCNSHYRRMRKYGDPLAGMPPRHASPQAALAANTEELPTGCVIWTGQVTHNGYGLLSANGSTVRAHRFAWEQANGKIPADRIIDHTCHTRACVNPAHMRLATFKHNMENRKGANKNSKSGVRGVSWHALTKKWRATVKHNRKQYYLGLFDSVEAAESAVVEKRRELFTHSDVDRA